MIKTELTLKEYQQLTLRTLPDLGSKQLNILHMILGLNSEFCELYEAIDDVNRGEEISDIAWYLSNYCNIENIDLWRIFEFRPQLYYFIPKNDDYIEQLQVAVAKLTDLVKKNFAYKKEINRGDILDSVELIAQRLNDCYAYYNINPFDSIYKNIEKLKIRFPEKFSEENANNRNLEAEYEALK